MAVICEVGNFVTMCEYCWKLPLCYVSSKHEFPITDGAVVSKIIVLLKLSVQFQNTCHLFAVSTA